MGKLYINLKFKHKMLLILILVFIPLMLMVSLIFLNANQVLKEQAIETMKYTAREVRSKIDDTIINVYNVSDAFASEPRLLEYLDKKYGDENATIKRQAVVLIIRRLFEGYNLLRQNEQISAIYTYQDELFNFLDPNLDQKDTIDKLKAMDIEDNRRLGKFYWYPVQENFLVENKYGEIRKDKVIMGARRVFSSIKASYAYIHIFTVKEEDIYEKYKNISIQHLSEVYIINDAGELLSTSNENVLAQGQINQTWLNILLNEVRDEKKKEGYFESINDQESYYISYAVSEVNNWIGVIVTPEAQVFQTTRRLYTSLMWIAIVSALIFTALLLYLYNSFMKPIVMLNESMKAVDQGDLSQHLAVKGQHEIKDMLTIYNSMINSIRYNIQEKLEMEKKKKELELDVLMSQVNPHFLYNTLESIVWMATDAKRPDIRRLAASLGRLYRLSVGNGEEMVRVSQEIEHVMAYIHIQENRFQDQVEFNLMTHTSDIQGFYTIKMILQPVVENIFLYGLEDKETTGSEPNKIQIYIKVKVFTDCIRFYIRDTGCGMDRPTLEKVRREIVNGKDKSTEERRSSGIGLNSIYARMKLHFDIEDGLSLYSRKNKGTLVIIKIPKMTKIDNEDKI